MNGVAIIPLADDCVYMKHWEITVPLLDYSICWDRSTVEGSSEDGSVCIAGLSSQHFKGWDACKSVLLIWQLLFQELLS